MRVREEAVRGQTARVNVLLVRYLPNSYPPTSAHPEQRLKSFEWKTALFLLLPATLTSHTHSWLSGFPWHDFHSAAGCDEDGGSERSATSRTARRARRLPPEWWKESTKRLSD